jgi:predicted Zn-dependent protease with MMP-like domain
VLDISDEQFETMIGEALDSLPDKYVSRLLQHVVVTWDNEPTPAQRRELKLRAHESLFGLYEGVPLTRRYTAGDSVLPDKITIFKHPILHYCRDMGELREQIRHTLWHEMAHYFGLDHDRIHELE